MKNKIITLLLTLTLLTSTLISVTSFAAGITTVPIKPFPTSGIAGKWIYTVTGVLTTSAIGNLDTVFICTNMEKTKSVDVGIEIFNSVGTLLNNISAGNGSVEGIPPGETTTFESNPISETFANEIISPSPDAHQGVARIVSSSPKIICTAQLMDDNNIPPTSMSQLNIVKQTTQKGD